MNAQSGRPASRPGRPAGGAAGGPVRRQATLVSAEDVARVVGRAFTERTWRIRLTAGQRRAILHPFSPAVVRLPTQRG
jgi:hypothetical protein